ncbi:hypothetical protein FBHYGVHD_CDS0008 [Staphylococcus phage MVC_VPHSA1]|uniref:Uncharacterized protein n=1 Tax=Staphylococcus phage MVC_VPHSA1 TaxID=3088876 RepID=A0ABZ0QZR5_9CAUD|nr:hypothetical protein FBHYGVHD_CDS0008 [Staphylococcus phage MVC_VPHSA1]
MNTKASTIRLYRLTVLIQWISLLTCSKKVN